MSLEAIKYSNGKLCILDQLLLPFETRYIPIVNADDAWTAIKSMQVRGAPAIAIVGCLSVAVELLSPALQPVASREELSAFVSGRMQHLLTARPTAVNIKTAAREVEDLLADLRQQAQLTVDQMKDKIVSYMEGMLESDIRDNKAIGKHGAAHIRDNCIQRPLRVLTHCNTGSLATAGYGTALGVVRSLRALGQLDHVYFTETRPYNQGSRLTAYELVHDAIPSTLICDSMAGWAMKTRGLSAVVVGADRVAANGDTANKIGTYQLAVLASYHSVPFYVAAPLTSIDWSIESGESIPVEERPASELTCIGGHRVAAEGVSCWNPAFDVTPSQLITGGIITERGVFQPQQLAQVLSRDQ